MRNQIQRGENITLIAPRALTSGEGFLVGSIFAVASAVAASGAPVVGVRVGGFTLPKATGQAWTPGLKLYWDNTAFNVTSTASGNTLIGAALGAAASGDTSGPVLLTGQIA